MSTRAVSAGRWLTPLAVLIPIAATPIVAVWVFTLDTGPGGARPLFGLLVLVSGLVAIALTGRLTIGLRKMGDRWSSPTNITPSRTRPNSRPADGAAAHVGVRIVRCLELRLKMPRGSGIAMHAWLRRFGSA